MNNKAIKILASIATIVVLVLISTQLLEAQCPMCRIAAESNLKDGGTAGRGLNAGILFLLSTPYWVIGGLAFVWWRNRKRVKE